MIVLNKIIMCSIIERSNDLSYLIPQQMAEYVLNGDDNYFHNNKLILPPIVELKPIININNEQKKIKLNEKIPAIEIPLSPNREKNMILDQKIPVIDSPVTPNRKKDMNTNVINALNKLNDIDNDSEIVYVDTRDIQKYKYLKYNNNNRQEIEETVEKFRTTDGKKTYLYFSVNKKYGGFSMCVSKTEKHKNIQLYSDAYRVEKNIKIMTYNGVSYPIHNHELLMNYINSNIV